jgi:signal transduction histidine kinase
LHRSNQDLLRQMERRTRLLRAANEVGKGVASILDLDKLLPKTVDIICDTYGFYYAGVFLLDKAGEWAVLRSGRGEAGRKMVAADHKLAVGGNSMIGAATGLREARIALDVGEEAVFFRNPYLPHTRSEMALPLVVGDKVLGAVTVQSVEERAFSEDDITSLQTMADHLAIAIHNGQLLQELEQAHAELLRTKTYEVLATATTEAIHWIGNKALPITATISRLQGELRGGEVDVASLQEDLELIGDSADLIVDVKENLIGPAREQKPRPTLVQDVVQAAAFHTQVPDGMLAVHVDPQAPMAIADTTQLARALGNLFRNAIEASAQRITVTVGASDRGDQVWISVADDGEGIPAENLDKIWASFFSTKGVGHSGLGLSACLHIMTQLGGHISVESQLGMGTTFTLSLPADLETPKADLSRGPDRVLLIDDDDVWARFVMQALTEAGKSPARQETAAGAAEADLILVDEALEAAPVAEMLADLGQAGVLDKTLVVTAAMKVERTTAHLNVGVKDVVLKPYTAAELAALLA